MRNAGAKMAVMNATAAQHTGTLDLGRSEVSSLLFAAALPVLLFVGVNFAANYFGLLPLFFAPFGLSGWVAAALHIGSLPLFGIGAWLAWRTGREGQNAVAWTAALVLGTVAFPFAVPLLDSMMLSVASMALLLVGLSAAVRAAKATPVAGFIMLPGMLWLGFSAVLGLSLVASWAPPFGLTNSTQAAS
jgi:tryptophan-rich sensory protein